MIRPVDYVGSQSRIVVRRNLLDSLAVMDMLRSYGFSCWHERHCGFWLVHYEFPRLKLVAGNAVRQQ